MLWFREARGGAEVITGSQLHNYSPELNSHSITRVIPQAVLMSMLNFTL